MTPAGPSVRDMRFSLSTNWCNRRLASGEEIADSAKALGFEELELGFHTTPEQVRGFKARLGEMPVGSVHAFCPVPISAPQGYPELYLLADEDETARGIARVHVKKNIEFAAEMGADVVVLHAGRVMCRRFFHRWDVRRRVKRGRKRVDVFRRELDGILPVLEKNGVTLGLENLPYLEGFPAEWEMADLAGDWVRPWFDTGHDYVRRVNGWVADALGGCPQLSTCNVQPVGLHISDSLGDDDHLPPGKGKVDFASLKAMAEGARHLVFEPNVGVTEAELKCGLEFIRKMWRTESSLRGDCP